MCQLCTVAFKRERNLIVCLFLQMQIVCSFTVRKKHCMEMLTSLLILLLLLHCLCWLYCHKNKYGMLFCVNYVYQGKLCKKGYGL